MSGVSASWLYRRHPIRSYTHDVHLSPRHHRPARTEGDEVSEWKIERIDKLEAVRRQLRTAIRLFFEEKDSVSVYTLASAVVELLRDLLKPSGKGSFIRDSDIIRPERKREFLEITIRPQNFFKHADRNPDELLEFRPEIVPFVLVDCVEIYRTLTGRSLREGYLFGVWFAMNYPELVSRLIADEVEKLKRIHPGVQSRAGFLEVLQAAHNFGDFD